MSTSLRGLRAGSVFGWSRSGRASPSRSKTEPSRCGVLVSSGMLAGAVLLGCGAETNDLFDPVGGEQMPRGTAGSGGRAGAGGVASSQGGALQPGQVGGNGGGLGGASAAGNTGGRAGNPRAGGPGAPNDAGAPGLADAAPSCDPCPCETGPFGPPELVTGFGLQTDVFGPALSADGLTMFFSSIDGDEDIFSATRTSRTSEFSNAILVADLDDGGSEEGTPFVSFDGLSLYFFSTRPGPDVVGARDLWFARRATADGAFGAPVVVPLVNAVGLDHLPRLRQDELTLLFVSGRESPNGASNIWVTERPTPDGDFSAPVELAGVNTDAREEGFTLSRDGLTLFFASNRVADDADTDIWVATRPRVADAFGPAESLTVVNTPAIEIDPALSTDGFELFFASQRNGSMQLFRSARLCPGG